MKRNAAVAALVALLLLVALGATLAIKHRSGPDDLAFWLQVAGSEDWSAKAVGGDPQAQFLVGVALIQTNLTKFVGRVPVLSGVPVVGKFFEDTSYSIDNRIGQEQLTEAHRWIKKSAEQGFAPAKEAAKLFPGRLVAPGSIPE
jgi:TPR repeat protein